MIFYKPEHRYRADWRTHYRTALILNIVVGCYRALSGYEIEITEDRIIAGSLEYSGFGYFKGKHLNFLEVVQELFFDEVSNSLSSGREHLGYKIRVEGREEAHTVRFRNQDMESGLYYARMECD